MITFKIREENERDYFFIFKKIYDSGLFIHAHSLYPLLVPIITISGRFFFFAMTYFIFLLAFYYL